MGRSVFSHDYTVAFVDVTWMTDEWEWQDWLDWSVIENIKHKYPSFEEVKDEWLDRESRIVLKNEMGSIVVCEYGGLASINLVPNDVDSGWGDMAINLYYPWCERIAPHMSKLFEPRLNRIGTMSNGVSVYEEAA